MKKIKKGTNLVSLLKKLQEIVISACRGCGYEGDFGQISRSALPEFAHYQFNGCFLIANKYRISPMEAAEKIAGHLRGIIIFQQVNAIHPGYVNIFLTDEFILSQINLMVDKESINLSELPSSKKIIIDFGGANIAKPLHVGHLRSAIIGESLKRIGRFLGHEIIGDIHLGDWGLQMGMVITEIKRISPELSYFDPLFLGNYPDTCPVNVDDLERIYPEASRRAKYDASVMEAAHLATTELQTGRRGYRALWEQIVAVSIKDLERDYKDLYVQFDLWLGESHSSETAAKLILGLLKNGKAYESEGAIIMDIALLDDNKPFPPLMLKNSSGAILYGATDLATIKQRMIEYSPDEIIYVVDKRQALHLEQVFRAARLINIVGLEVKLEHIDFGTMNGNDNKPFKTRAGGTMKLKDLIAIIINSARGKLKNVGSNLGRTEDEDNEIARKVGVATLKFADLSNHRMSDYVFEINRFSSFEGRTGPYLLYSIVRANSILEKARKKKVAAGNLVAPMHNVERDLLLKLLEFPDLVPNAWYAKSPKLLCDFSYELAALFSRFYHECPVLAEEDIRVSGSRLFLVEIVRDVLSLVFDLLGIETIKKM